MGSSDGVREIMIRPKGRSITCCEAEIEARGEVERLASWAPQNRRKFAWDKAGIVGSCKFDVDV